MNSEPQQPSDESLRPGDEVQHREGGPLMSLQRSFTDDEGGTQWVVTWQEGRKTIISVIAAGELIRTRHARELWTNPDDGWH